jgi:2-keto-3-deoxy-L-rhamnonate aldolase RhmA
MRNPFKAALARADKLIGLWLSMASPYTAEICATAGFHWLPIDGEHAPNERSASVGRCACHGHRRQRADVELLADAFEVADRGHRFGPQQQAGIVARCEMLASIVPQAATSP